LADRKRIKKNRKPKYPKNMEKVIPGFKPDPERWLPKWQRKGYKKRGKKGMGKTQGLATVGREETKNVYTSKASTSNQ
jgi:signal recognition particle subunit SRP72